MASVFGDATTEEVDGFGQETGLRVPGACEVAHSEGREEFARNAVGFSVVVMSQNGSDSRRLRLRSGRR
jgi:hypothetical protein